MLQAEDKSSLQADLQSLRAEAEEVDADNRDSASRDLSASSDDGADDSSERSISNVIDVTIEGKEKDVQHRSAVEKHNDDDNNTSHDTTNGNVLTLRAHCFPSQRLQLTASVCVVHVVGRDLASPLGERDMSSSDTSDEDEDEDEDGGGDDGDNGANHTDELDASAAATATLECTQRSEILSCVAPDMEDGANADGGARAILHVEDYQPRSETERCAVRVENIVHGASACAQAQLFPHTCRCMKTRARARLHAVYRSARVIDDCLLVWL